MFTGAACAAGGGQTAAAGGDESGGRIHGGGTVTGWTARALLRELTGQKRLHHPSAGRADISLPPHAEKLRRGNVRRTTEREAYLDRFGDWFFHAWRSAARAAVLRRERKRSGLAANSRGGCGRTARIGGPGGGLHVSGSLAARGAPCRPDGAARADAAGVFMAGDPADADAARSAARSGRRPG